MAESEDNPSIVGDPLAVPVQDAVAELVSYFEKHLRGGIAIKPRSGGRE
jgi:hypothetical protein